MRKLQEEEDGHTALEHPGKVIEEVEVYKYLDVHIDSRLNWKTNDAIYKKGMS